MFGDHPPMPARDWAIAFATTLVAELPVYVLFSRRSFAIRAAVAVAFLLNLATHPVAWSVFRFGHISFPYGFLAVEAGVVLAEALLLFAAAHSRFACQPLRATTCLAISFAANCSSAGLSLLVWS
jgi:hypothetical protein